MEQDTAQRVTCPRCGESFPVHRNPFLTVDAIVHVNDDRIVLVARKNPPLGWALPGGFVDYGESLEDAIVRELREETGLDAVNLRQFRAYSDPRRDPRHHTVTVVFSILGRGQPRAGDDAGEIRLITLDEIPHPMAFDHARILADYRLWLKRCSNGREGTP